MNRLVIDRAKPGALGVKFPASHDQGILCRRLLESHGREVGLPEGEEPVLQLVTSELLTNAIDHGGNMDFNAIQPGSTVHIRAQKPGGLLSLGDVHARMGDGELTGAGVEIDSAITLKVSRSPGFPNSSPVVETTGVVESAEEYLTSARAAEWGEALKLAWLEMVALIIDRYDTSYEYANMIVGTIGDARPGFATGYMGGYLTCQIAVTKELRRTGEPYQP